MSTNLEHGRLRIGRKVARGIYTESGNPVCIVDTMGELPGYAVDVAVARRLVACWNACEGIRTEALEHRSHLLKAGDDQITMLTAQRDELLEALGHIAEYWNRDSNEAAMADALWYIIETSQTAIAKAEASK